MMFMENEFAQHFLEKLLPVLDVAMLDISQKSIFHVEKMRISFRLMAERPEK